MICSILDQDLYTFTVGQAVLDHFPDVDVSYKFTDRKKLAYNEWFLDMLNSEIQNMSKLQLILDERAFLKKTCPFLTPGYLDFLQNYRFDPSQVKATLDADNRLHIEIKGKWYQTIFWEVPLLALISECYFKVIDTNWTMEGQARRAIDKGKKLSANGCTWADFGTRRRRSSVVQDIVVASMRHEPGFSGTSNVHYAARYNVKPIGTMSHQWIMGVSAIDGLRRANKFALSRWVETYDGSLGVALPDTFGVAAFFEDFDAKLARLYDGVRHDSGDPYVFGEKLIEHYKQMRMNPLHKTAVFTDGLTVDKAIEIKNRFESRIGVSFGIGTHFTNDFDNSPALNIVIKLLTCNGVPVVKLSDEPGKATGDADALRVAKWTFLNQPLDS